MQAGSYWSHAEWKHHDERRLQFTLGLSVLLHVVVVVFWKMPAPVWKAADHAVLTVLLRGAAPQIQSSPTAGEKPQEGAILIRKDPAPADFSVRTRPVAPGTSAPPAAKPSPSMPAVRGRVAARTTPGSPSNRLPSVAGVTVRLTVDGDGRVQQIFWKQLPALTDAQLRRVEALIREKTYAGGRTISEIVDVRGLLKLPPDRTDEDVALPLDPMPGEQSGH